MPAAASSWNPLARYLHWLHTRWPAGGVERLPVVREDGSTRVPGLYVVGDLTGVPLLKFSADSGARAVDAIMAEPRFAAARERKPAGVHDLVIIGAGVSGMAAALQANKRGLDFVIVEATQVFSTVANFPKGKPIYTYPKDMVPAGELQFTAEVKEALLDEMRGQAAGIDVRTLRVERVRRDGDVLLCELAGGDKAKDKDKALRALRVIIAIGRSGNFRKLGVPGEELDKVYNRLHDPKDYAEKRVLVVGGGDSALEAAIALTQGGADVTLSYRKPEFARPKPDNLERIAALVKDPSAPVAVEQPTSERVTTASGVFLKAAHPGRLTVMLASELKEIRSDEVVLSDKDKREVRLPNDVVFAMIGREAPLDFLRRSGVPIHGETQPLGWIFLATLLLFCTFLYAWKSGGPTEHWLDPFPDSFSGSLAKSFADRSTVLGTLAVSLKSRSFYYTLLYSLCIVTFGIQRIRRRKTPYVKWQTLSLIGFQLIPLFILPEIILPWLGYNGFFTGGTGGAFADNLFEKYISEAEYAAGTWPSWGHPRAYWRAYGFILAWPLSVYNVFTDKPMGWWLAISFLQTFVLIPLLIYRYGKGVFCGWICSCGALAETMGDQQRTKMPHGPIPNRLNAIGQVFLAIAFVMLFIRIAGWLWPESWAARSFHLLLEGKNHEGRLVNPLSYKWFIDILFGGILGVGLYFKYSGRVWCRFACPLAALMHIYTRFSRFRIFADKKKCISCNVCTSVCHMGIDVMNFANKGLPMQDPECVRCSACVQSCPTGVLSFGVADADNKPRRLDRIPASLVQIRENPAARKKPASA
ncbi:MAG: NAD(P)-binding domain-containing protein [Polyangia bacterium]